ncbi:MAG: hypothetical protein Q9225_005894 [Loekoesia sp. 1 TL-2023]
MKTPYYTGAFTAAQHTNVQDDDQLRERMLEYRLANRDDVRDIYVVTAVPFKDRLGGSLGSDLVQKASKKSKTDLSWTMHWALQVGDQFFELQRGYPDPMRTGLRMSKWDQEQQSQIIQRYRQGVTAMTDDEIRSVGERYFSRLQRIDINLYDVWCNNCQVAVDRILRDIGGLSYYRSQLKSLHEMVRQFFYNSILRITQLYGRHRGWNEEIITKNAALLHHTLRIMTSRSKYPKRHWIQRDLEMAEGVSEKVGAVKNHWFLTVLESSLSLRQGSEELYVRRGADDKLELNFDAVKEATKGIFDEDEKDWRLAWLKAMPWLTAGFTLGTIQWAAAILSIACRQMSKIYEDPVGLKGGLEQSLVGLSVSPDLGVAPSSSFKRPQNRRRDTTGPRRVRSKAFSVDNNLVARYEKCLTNQGVPYFYDHINKLRTWDAPDQQEMCLRITDPPLSKRWEKKQEGHTFYINRITGEKTDTRPGPAEIWAVKKKVKPDWVKSTVMALPCGWEMRRTEEGEMYYINHNVDPSTTTTDHPMRREIEDERRILLPEWNVEWDDDRGKKYRKIQTGEIRWKAIDGPRYEFIGDRAKITLTKPRDDFIEPLPPGWGVVVRDGQKMYRNGKTGKDRVERITHPLTDKRRRLFPEWEMRYTPNNKRYWVHHGRDGRGTTWWTRNKLLKNTSLKNNASGWKLARNGYEWEWFEGGDIPHSEIPMLDLDDPAELEFREYPFILPARTTTLDGNFIEPLPANWVRRTKDDGSTYYWNFKDRLGSEHHPNDEERRDLPALWEMRYTRHGKQYYIHHDDSSTWWTHPREVKREQQLRARPGQSQDGWKLAEDGKTWERFEEHPDAQLTEESADTPSPKQSAESETLQDERTPEVWRSLSFTREWLKSANSSEAIAKAMTHIPKTPVLFKKYKSSPSIDSVLEQSPQEYVEDEDLTEDGWRVDTPEMTEEPPSMEEPQHETPSPKGHLKKSWARPRDPRTLFKKSEHSPSFGSSLFRSLQETVRAERQGETGPVNEEPQSGEGLKTPSPPEKGNPKEKWTRRTPSFFARKTKGKKSSEEGSILLDEEDWKSDTQPAIDGLGITGTERVGSGVDIAMSPPTEEKEAANGSSEKKGDDMDRGTDRAGVEKGILEESREREEGGE